MINWWIGWRIESRFHIPLVSSSAPLTDLLRFTEPLLSSDSLFGIVVRSLPGGRVFAYQGRHDAGSKT